ncbi:MAG: TonB-dependent receptor, partial [Bacteroidetes bacterium]|nr:TonB-dependent receptor [Bacteroidota bacterium]
FNASLMKHFTHSLDLPDQFRPTTSSDALNNGQRTKLDWQNNLRFVDHNLVTFGVESSTEKSNSSYLSTSDYGPYDSFSPEQSVRTTGLYLQDQLDVDQSLFVTAGLRYDNNQKFGGVTTFRIAPAYFIHTTETKLKFSYGTGFKAPSLFDLFDPLFGNPDLNPEKSKGWDAGIEQFLLNGKISLGLTYFNLRFENMFGYDENYKTINIAKASSHGIEVTANVKNFARLNINASYTYTETNNDYNLSSDFNQPLLRRPKDQFELNVNWNATEKFDLNLETHYVGKRWDKDFTDMYNPVRVEMPDYILFNLAASYKLFDYLELNAQIKNLFDKQYEEVLYYGTLGRSLYAGLSLTF